MELMIILHVHLLYLHWERNIIQVWNHFFSLIEKITRSRGDQTSLIHVDMKTWNLILEDANFVFIVLELHLLFFQNIHIIC